jgi:ketosteroid isomerase-like protein
MADIAPALQQVLDLVEREVTVDEYHAIRALWFQHVDNEEKLFVPHTDEVGAAALNAVMATFTDDGEVMLPTGESWKGQARIREFYAFFLSAFEGMVWEPRAVVIGPQGVADIAEMTAVQQKPFGPLDKVGSPVRVQWVIHWPWDQQAQRFTGEIIYSLTYLPL